MQVEITINNKRSYHEGYEEAIDYLKSRQEDEEVEENPGTLYDAESSPDYVKPYPNKIPVTKKADCNFMYTKEELEGLGYVCTYEGKTGYTYEKM